MHKNTSPRPKSFKRLAIGSTVVVAIASGAALVAGVGPASAGELIAQPDTQIAIFMVPLTLLVLATMIEVARMALRGPLPASAPTRVRKPRHWSPGRGEG